MLPMYGDGTIPQPFLMYSNKPSTGAVLSTRQAMVMQGGGVAQVSTAKRPDQFFTSDPVFFVASFLLLASFVLSQVSLFLA